MKRVALVGLLLGALVVLLRVVSREGAGSATGSVVEPEQAPTPGARDSDQNQLALPLSTDPDGDASERSAVGPPATSGPDGEEVAEGEDAELPEELLWAREFGGLSGAELQDRTRALETEFNAMQSDLSAPLFDAGLYEVIPSGTIGAKEAAGDEIAVHELGPDNELHRVVLREEDYPKLHAMRRKLAWLRSAATIPAPADDH